MECMEATLVVLAAGMGSRYGGIKQIEKVGPNGESLIDYSVYNSLKAGFRSVIFVVRKDIEAQIREFFAGKFPADADIQYVHQELSDIPPQFTVPPGRTKPWGTGQALLACKAALKGRPFVMINGDDYYAYDALASAINFFETVDTAKPNYAVVGYKLKETLSEFGSVSRGICKVDAQGNLTHLEEHTKISKTVQDNVQRIVSDRDGSLIPLTGDEPVSMNLFSFTPPFIAQLEAGFVDFLSKNAAEKAPEKTEFFVPAYLGEMVATGKASARLLTTGAEWFGITYQDDAPRVRARLAELTAAGAYPTPLFAKA